MPLSSNCVECEMKGPHCFCSLDRVALEKLDGIGTRIRLAAGEQVQREGYDPTHVYVVCHGTLKITASSVDGRMLILRIAGPGDVLGLAAALKRSNYEATAETLEHCELKSIPRTKFILFMEEFQAVSRNTALSVAREYESAVMSARRLALSGSATARLANVLLEWGEKQRSHTPGIQFLMPLTHEELGQMAGISRETTTRALTQLRQQGLVLLHGQRMTLPDPEGLRSAYS